LFFRFNESKAIGFSIYNTVFFAAFIVIILATDIPNDTQWIIASVTLVLASVIPILSLLSNKIWLLKKGGEDVFIVESSGTTGKSAESSGTNTIELEAKVERYNKLEKRYRRLKEKYRSIKREKEQGRIMTTNTSYV